MVFVFVQVMSIASNLSVMSDVAQVAITASTAIFIIISIIGNFLVCVVLIKNRDMR